MTFNVTSTLNYGLGESADILRETVLIFEKNKIAPSAAKTDKINYFPIYLWKKMGELVVLSITAEEEHGGAAMGYLEHGVAMEEISRASASIGFSFGAHSNLCADQIRRKGGEEKNKYPPKLISAEHIGALAVSEPEAGSDLVSMRLRTERRGDRFIF